MRAVYIGGEVTTLGECELGTVVYLRIDSLTEDEQRKDNLYPSPTSESRYNRALAAGDQVRWMVVAQNVWSNDTSVECHFDGGTARIGIPKHTEAVRV